MNLTVRPAERADVPTILEIVNEAIVNTTASYYDEPRTLEEQLAWFDAKLEAGLPVLVAEVEGGVAGWASFGPFRPWPGYRFTVEHSVYVAAPFRGRGVGAGLLGPLVRRAETMGMHVIIAGIDAANEASLRLHERFGFVQVAHFREVGFKFDRWLDLVFVQLTLDPIQPASSRG